VAQSPQKMTTMLDANAMCSHSATSTRTSPVSTMQSPMIASSRPTQRLLDRRSPSVTSSRSPRT
jgi:hypothetical protein